MRDPLTSNSLIVKPVWVENIDSPGEKELRFRVPVKSNTGDVSNREIQETSLIESDEVRKSQLMTTLQELSNLPSPVTRLKTLSVINQNTGIPVISDKSSFGKYVDGLNKAYALTPKSFKDKNMIEASSGDQSELGKLNNMIVTIKKYIQNLNEDENKKDLLLSGLYPKDLAEILDNAKNARRGGIEVRGLISAATLPEPFKPTNEELAERFNIIFRIPEFESLEGYTPRQFKTNPDKLVNIVIENRLNNTPGWTEFQKERLDQFLKEVIQLTQATSTSLNEKNSSAIQQLTIINENLRNDIV